MVKVHKVQTFKMDKVGSSKYLITLGVQVKAVLEEFAKVLFDVTTCIPEKRPHIQDGDPLLATNLLHALGVLLCNLKLAIEGPRGIPRSQIGASLVSIHGRGCKEDDARNRGIVRRCG